MLLAGQLVISRVYPIFYAQQAVRKLPSAVFFIVYRERLFKLSGNNQRVLIKLLCLFLLAL